MKRKLLTVLLSFAIAFSTVACTKTAPKADTKVEENKEGKTENKENADAKGNDEKFVNVDENDKKRAMELLEFLSTDDFAKIKEKLHDEVKQYQNDESYELNNNVFKDTGKISELEGLTKQEREDKKVGKIVMYSGQAKGENQSIAFDIIETADGKLVDWRFFPVQDQQANLKKYDNIVKRIEDIASKVESGDYEKLKPELELMEMKEDAHKNFEKQLKTLVEQTKNRKEFRVLNITDRTAVKSLEKIGVTGKIVNAVALVTYEEGPAVQYSTVFSEDGRLLSIGLNPIQTQPQVQAPKMPEDNAGKTEDKTEESKDKNTEDKKTE